MKTHCDECGQSRETAETSGARGMSHRVCRECYDATPEPDTGRPDWKDLRE